jgi:hypothetical protein
MIPNEINLHNEQLQKIAALTSKIVAMAECRS